MSLKLLPDFVFDSYDMVTPQFLCDHGIKFIFTDVDNTLEPYENAVPGEGVLTWLSNLSDIGVRVAIISNNNKERIELFNKDLGLIAYSKAKKPCAKFIKSAMKELGADRNNSIFLGDQIFTDVLAAHNAGIPSVLVPPIKDKTDVFTRFKRWCEKPIIKKYNKLHKKAGQNSQEDV